ncbi:MAG: AbiV family abortive infection protein [Candidatus Aegiribacteria sp.]|nr:AbiV family abortive infection protein [Candidatus Aegiribacteria sp.]
MAKGLDQWKNTLKPHQIAEGMNAARANAQRLLDDADILLKSGSYPSALSLAILSIEESGKVSILRQLALARDGNEVKEAWKAYRSHTKKNASWTFPDFVAKGARKLEEFRGMFNDESEHQALLDHLKQIAFYTDCLGKAHWSQPSEVIDHDTAKEILSIAKLMLGKRVHTTKEIELWIKHIRPVWKGSMESMKNALHEWFKAMTQEGLYEEGKLPIEQFLGLD